MYSEGVQVEYLLNIIAKEGNYESKRGAAVT